MPSSQAQLRTILSLATILSQFACGRIEGDDLPTDDEDGTLGSGGAVGTGGSDGSGGSNASGGSGSEHWTEGTVGTGATAGCVPQPKPSICGEDGCEIGDSFTRAGGTGGEDGECVFFVEAGPTGTCGTDGATMAYCDRYFCDDHEWLTWQSECLPPIE